MEGSHSELNKFTGNTVGGHTTKNVISHLGNLSTKERKPLLNNSNTEIVSPLKNTMTERSIRENTTYGIQVPQDTWKQVLTQELPKTSCHTYTSS